MVFIKYIKTILLFLVISSISAISNVQIEPTNPNVGDVVTISGIANPNEEIPIQAEFSVIPLTSNPYYGYLMYDVNIPNTPNNFKVIGENVNDLQISVKMGMWITKSAVANGDGVAIVSKSNVPVGTYDMKIGGTIKNISKPVNLKISASTTISANSNGNFKYTYNTNNIPEGTTVYLNIGGIKKQIVVGGNLPSPPSQSLQTPIGRISENISDTTPPKINIYYPKSSNYNTSNLSYKFSIQDNSNYEVKVYLNNALLSPYKNNNEYNGTLKLNDGVNIFKIVAKDKYGNEDTKTIKLIYTKKTINMTTNTDKNIGIINKELLVDNNSSKNTINNKKEPSKNNDKLIQTKNIIYGTVIKKSGNATLIISDETEVNTSGDVILSKVILKNTTDAYLIKPDNAKFSKEVILKVKINNNNNNSGSSISVLRYDNKLKNWVSTPYTLDNNTIIIKTTNSGYYAIKIETLKETNKSFIEEISQTFSNLYSIVLYLLSKIFK